MTDLLESILDGLLTLFGGRHERQLTMGCISALSIGGVALLLLCGLVVWLVFFR